MKLKDIINKYGIKHSRLGKEMGLSKAGFHNVLNDKGTIKRTIQLRNVLYSYCDDLLNDLRKN